MPCTADRINMENKNTAWEIALADFESAKTTAAIADSLFAGSCTVAILSGGIAGPLCATAIAHLAWRLTEMEAARDRSNIAMHAALEAVANYGKCMAKMTRNVE